MSIKKKISLLLSELTDQNLIKTLYNADNIFFDEPKINFYSCLINDKSSFFKNNNYDLDNLAVRYNLLSQNLIYGAGVSFKSKYMAILKCVCESIERLCMFCFNYNDFILSQYPELKQNALDPNLFINTAVQSSKTDYRNVNFSWMNGFQGIKGENILIPAQLFFLNYKRLTGEIRLTEPISTGAAGGFDSDETLLRAIYEVVERDAFMTVYLNKIKAKKISVDSVNNDAVNNIHSVCSKYKLGLHLFEITNDLLIPTYLSILIDKTGIGPGITLGLKAGMNRVAAITGCLEEAFLSRTWLRYEITIKRRRNIPDIDYKNMSSFISRGSYWYKTNKIRLLNFLIAQKNSKFAPKKVDIKFKSELNNVYQLLKKRKIEIYYTDISLPNFKKLGFIVYKVIIPNLQPLYFKESSPLINVNRLKSVADYFGKKYTGPNTIPHPFL